MDGGSIGGAFSMFPLVFPLPNTVEAIIAAGEGLLELDGLTSVASPPILPGVQL